MSCELLACDVRVGQCLLEIDYRCRNASLSLVNRRAVVCVLDREQDITGAKLSTFNETRCDCSDLSANLCHKLGAHTRAHLAIGDDGRSCRGPDSRHHIDTDGPWRLNIGLRLRPGHLQQSVDRDTCKTRPDGPRSSAQLGNHLYLPGQATIALFVIAIAMGTLP